MRNLSHKYSKNIVGNLAIASLVFLSSCKYGPEWDTVYYNVSIHTPERMQDNSGRGYVAIKDGAIADLGWADEDNSVPRGAEEVDMKGAHLYPGFIDAHGHLFGYAHSLHTVSLFGTKSKEECVARMVEFAAQHPDGWIVGRGWDQNDWATQEWPTANDLAPLGNRLVYMTRIDGHAAWVSKSVLEQFNITAQTTVPGGEVVVHNGEASGILIDNAEGLVEVPAPSREEWIQYLLEAQDSLLKYGLTSMTDAGLDKNQITLLDSLMDADLFHIPMNVMVTYSADDLAWLHNNGPIDKPLLRVKSVKAYLDGALGSRGALLRAPYHDLPSHYGLQLLPASELDSLRDLCVQHGWQLCVHAIGDSAHHLLLQSFAELPEDQDLRFRVEHAQIMTPEDSTYYAHKNIIPSAQPTHATSDMYWAEDRIGPHRIHHAYSYKRLLNASGNIALGTDFPIEQIDPLLTYFAATSRKDLHGHPTGGFLPSQRLSPGQTMYGMTAGAAYAQFEERKKGRIAIGMAASFTILNAPLDLHSPEEFGSIHVIGTIVNGQMRYSNWQN